MAPARGTCSLARGSKGKGAVSSESPSPPPPPPRSPGKGCSWAGVWRADKRSGPALKRASDVGLHKHLPAVGTLA